MIEQVVLHNYKSIKEASITLKNINIMIGVNGVGKSNLISFFELLRSIYDKKLNTFVLQNGGIDRFLFNGKKVSPNIEAIVDFDNTNAFFLKLLPAIDDKVVIEYTGDYFNNKHIEDKNYKLWHRKLWDENVGESNIAENSLWRAEYVRNFLTSFTVYHFHDTSRTSNMRGYSNISDNQYLRADASNIAAYLYMMSKKDTESFKLLEGVVKSIAPYFKRFNLSPDRNDSHKIKLEWEEENSNAYMDAYNFSDGTIRFIALATLLLQKNKPEVIVIDEPEIGLHPSAIIKLAAMIKRAAIDSQVIIATQSVNLVNQFSAADILIVNRKDGQTTFDRIKDEPVLQSWLEDYNIGDIWEKNVIGEL